VTTKDMTGVTWFPKPDPVVAFGSGETHNVKPGNKVLTNAVAAAAPGDVIELAAGDYTLTRTLKLDKPLTFKSSGDANIVFEGSALFQINDGGSLRVEGLNISGAEAPDNAGNAVIRTSPYAMLRNYRLEIVNSNFVDNDVNHSFSIVKGSKGTFADNILIENSNFSDVTGAVLKLSSETDDYGIYNSEYVTIRNSAFKDIGGSVVDYYRGGTDESTFGPHFLLENSTLSNVGKDKRNKSKASLYLHGVQVTNVSGNTFTNSRPFLINHTVGEPKTVITGNTFSGTDAPLVYELNSGLEPTAKISDNIGINP